MASDTRPDVVSIHLRLPKELHRRLVREAKRINISLNRQIVILLGTQLNRALDVRGLVGTLQKSEDRLRSELAEREAAVARLSQDQQELIRRVVRETVNAMLGGTHPDAPPQGTSGVIEPLNSDEEGPAEAHPDPGRAGEK